MNVAFALISAWHHQMETFSALLALCARNSSVTSEIREAGDLRRQRAHYDVTVMRLPKFA